MSRPDKSIDPRILASAQEEFLTHGYEKASLKVICANANVTTGALYKRYKGKEELFSAVVTPTLNDLEEVAKQRRSLSAKDVSDEDLIKAWDMDEEYMLWWFRYLYDHQKGMLLLLTCSHGTRHATFVHDWPKMITKYSYEYYEEAYKRGLTTVKMEKTELHILLSSFWTTIFDPFVHKYNWKQIEEHSTIVCKLFDWYTVFGFKR
jgi:AcrR family transcriptional regulator